jgi:hypothetical protein
LKIRIYILTLLTFTICRLNCFGTSQIPDRLIYNGDTVSIFSNPLEQHPDIYGLRPKLFGDKQSCNSTACWREYQAKWEIVDDDLYLIGIYSCCFYEDKIQANLKQLFPDKHENGKVKADWVTAKILSPQGKQIYYVHMGYESLYEKEVVYEIVNGQLKGITTYDNSKSRISIYRQDTILHSFIYSNIKWEALPKTDKTVKVYLQFSANEQGEIDSVEVMKGFDELFDNEAIRIVKSIPEWDIYYRRGEHERRAWVLPIFFSEENRKKYKKTEK